MPELENLIGRLKRQGMSEAASRLTQAKSALDRSEWESANAQVSGLDGTLQRLDEKILVLSPRNVELSCETAAGFLQEDLFSQA